jgi:hypothetical protein
VRWLCLRPNFAPCLLSTMSTSKQRQHELAAVSFLVELLQNPDENITCFYFLLGLVDKAGDLGGRVDLQNMTDTERTAVDSLLTASMFWITVPRTHKELGCLESMHCLCTNVKKADVIHQRGLKFFSSSSSSHATPFVCFFHHIGNAVASACYKDPRDLDQQSVDRGYLRILHQRRSTWPTRFEQVLPHGPEDTTRGLLMWMKSESAPFISPVVIQALNPFLALTLPLTILYVFTSHALITDAVLPIINAMCEYIENNISANKTEPIDTNVDITLSRVLELMSNIAQRWSDDLQRRHWMSPHTTHLLEMYDRILTACDLLHLQGRPLRSPIPKRSALLGTLLLQDFPGLARRTAANRTRKLLHLSHKPPSRTSWANMLWALSCVTVTHRCVLPGCMRTTADVNALRLCGGCRRVAYCSRRCQKTDWSYSASGVLPHRDVCQVLRDTCQIHGLRRRLRATDMSSPPSAVFRASAGDKIARYFLERTRLEILTCRTCFFVSTRSCTHSRASGVSVGGGVGDGD